MFGGCLGDFVLSSHFILISTLVEGGKPRCQPTCGNSGHRPVGFSWAVLYVSLSSTQWKLRVVVGFHSPLAWCLAGSTSKTGGKTNHGVLFGKAIFMHPWWENTASIVVYWMITPKLAQKEKKWPMTQGNWSHQDGKAPIWCFQCTTTTTTTTTTTRTRYPSFSQLRETGIPTLKYALEHVLIEPRSAAVALVTFCVDYDTRHGVVHPFVFDGVACSDLRGVRWFADKWVLECHLCCGFM